MVDITAGIPRLGVSDRKPFPHMTFKIAFPEPLPRNLERALTAAKTSKMAVFSRFQLPDRQVISYTE